MAEKVIEKLLLVLDAAVESPQAVDFALDLAHRLSCKLIAVHVIDTDMVGHLVDMRVLLTEERDDMLEALEMQGNRILNDLKSRCCELNVTLHDALRCRGRFDQAVLKVAKKTGADAVVVGGWRVDSSKAKDNSSIVRHLLLEQATFPVFVIHG